MSQAVRSAIWRRAALAGLPLGIPVAAAWVRQRERIVLRCGRPLTSTEIADAQKAGVQLPDRVRVLAVRRIEVFHNPALQFLIGNLGDAFASTLGLTLRYGILVRSDWNSDRRLLAHELVHVAQYERLGGIAPFLLSYFRECVREGYPFGELEREAIEIARRICGSGS